MYTNYHYVNHDNYCGAQSGYCAPLTGEGGHILYILMILMIVTDDKKGRTIAYPRYLYLTFT